MKTRQIQQMPFYPIIRVSFFHLEITGFVEGVSLDHVTMSTDAYGSFPIFDSQGKLIKYDYGKPNVLLETLKKLVLKHNWPLDRALPLCTSNVATYLGFNRKGFIKTGLDADILVLDRNLTVQYHFAKGVTLKTPTYIKRAMFPCL